jgi:hypothetical protein
MAHFESLARIAAPSNRPSICSAIHWENAGFSVEDILVTM